MPRLKLSTLIALLVSVAAATAHAQGAGGTTVALPVGPTGKIEGQVFDSLTMLNLARAQVWIPGTSHSTISSESGRFTLTDVPAGRHLLAFSTMSIDSLGLGTLGSAVEVTAGETARPRLATPSALTVWKALCGNRPRLGPDSGIVWGTVKDAATDVLLRDAPALFSWYDMSLVGKKVHFDELRTEVRSDSSGTYFACGLPTTVAMSAKALGTASASGEVEFVIGVRALSRVDFLVSTDMKVSELRALSDTQHTRARGTSILRGIVRDDLGRRVADALVSVASADTAIRTNGDGTFLLRSMPAGTHGVQVRSLGYSLTTRLVDLRPNTTTDIQFSIPTTTTMAVFNVRAEAIPRPDHKEFNERRKLGFGRAFELKQGDYVDAADVLKMVPRVQVSYNRGVPAITMPDGTSTCNPTIYLDGMKSDMEAITLYPIDNIRAVEVYTSKYQVPARFMGSAFGGCGVVLYWTKYRW